MTDHQARVAVAEACRYRVTLGFVRLGGPTGQIAMMDLRHAQRPLRRSLRTSARLGCRASLPFRLFFRGRS